jgi:hypothetical protein
MLWTTGERPDGEPFEEQPTRIGMQLWRDLPRPGDVESAVRSDLPRGLIGRHQVRCRGTSRWWHARLRQNRCALAPNLIRCSTENGRWHTEGRGRLGRRLVEIVGIAAHQRQQGPQPRGCHVRPRRRSRLTLGLHRYSVGAVRHSRRMVAGPALIGIAELLVSPGNRSTIP